MRCSVCPVKAWPHLLLVSSIGMTTRGHELDRYRRLRVIPRVKKICFNVRRPVILQLSNSKTEVKYDSIVFGGGGGGIRTPETLTGLTVFKTVAFNHSATPPH